MIEKIMEEIGELYVDETGYGYECNLKEYSEVLCGNCCECIKSACKVIIRKHMNDGWNSVEKYGLPKDEGVYDLTIINGLEDMLVLGGNS